MRLLPLLGALLLLGASPGDSFDAARARLVRSIGNYAAPIDERADPRILAAMGAVPRHLFVPEGVRGKAYGDYPLPIGEGQTISQPSLVALMTHLLRPQPDDRVLVQRCDIDGSAVVTVHNLGSAPAVVDVPVDPDGEGLEAVDLMADEVVTGESAARVVLDAYGFRWWRVRPTGDLAIP